MQIEKLPAHIAVIMDGNGRWAKKRFLPRVAGHRAGVEAARQIVTNSAKRGIRVLSLFAFSSENWRRPQAEVGALMDLFLKGLEREVGQLHNNNIQVRFIGDRTRLNPKLILKITEVEVLTAKNTGMVLIVAVDYGGQWDICQAVQQLAKQIEQKTLTSQDITPQHIATHLSFADLPDPDLFIRTSGELRISNFMLWQLAYSELYFTNTLWPDFNENEFDKALAQFATRDRRYGTSCQNLTETNEELCLNNE